MMNHHTVNIDLNPIRAKLFYMQYVQGEEAEPATLKFFHLDIINRDQTLHNVSLSVEKNWKTIFNFCLHQHFYMGTCRKFCIIV